MKKFTGIVQYADKSEVYLRKQHTHVTIYYEENDAPKVEKGDTVEIRSDYHFPKTTDTGTFYKGGPLETRTIRGRYYLHSTEISEFNIL